MNRHAKDFINRPVHECKLYIQYAYLRIKRKLSLFAHRKEISKYTTETRILLNEFAPTRKWIIKAGIDSTNDQPIIIEVNHLNKLIMIQQAAAEVVLEYRHVDTFWKQYQDK